MSSLVQQPLAGGLKVEATSAPTQVQYWPQINALRVLAVAFVLGDHYLGYYFTKTGFSGSHGVYLFFVISGFLITSILLSYRDEVDAGETSVGGQLKRFYARRSLRIFPIYYLTLFAMMAAGQFKDADNFLWLLTYTQNIYAAIKGDWGQLGHFWSLATEEQFYLVWPLVVLLAPRKSLVWILVGAIALAIGFRLEGALTGQGGELAYYTLPIASLDTLGLGALLALAPLDRFETARAMFRKYGVLLLLPVFLIIPLRPTLGFLQPTVVGLASLWMIEMCRVGVGGLMGRILSLPIVLYVGQISYGIYAYHQAPHLILPIETFAFQPGPLQYLVSAVVYTAMTLALAALSWRFFEQPINRLKDRFGKRAPSAS